MYIYETLGVSQPLQKIFVVLNRDVTFNSSKFPHF